MYCVRSGCPTEPDRKIAETVSLYVDFVQDFPARCSEVLKLTDSEANASGREVTLMLMAAAAGLVVPWERLRTKQERESTRATPDGSRHPPVAKQPRTHPTKDVDKYPQAAARLSKWLGENFKASPIWKRGLKSWKFGSATDVSKHPDEWPGFDQRRGPESSKQIVSVVKTIRNALAHGSIYTRGKRSIEEIVLFEEWRPEGIGEVAGYDYLTVSPQDFRILLETWFDLLRDQSISLAEVHNIVDARAAHARAA